MTIKYDQWKNWPQAPASSGVYQVLHQNLPGNPKRYSRFDGYFWHEESRSIKGAQEATAHCKFESVARHWRGVK